MNIDLLIKIFLLKFKIRESHMNVTQEYIFFFPVARISEKTFLIGIIEYTNTYVYIHNCTLLKK